MAREINLVPDIKGEMIRALKLRNLIFFLCIVVAIASVAATALVGLVMGGQQLALDSKKDTISKLSEKLKSFSDLDDFITIRDQLNSISTLTNNKMVLSRTFDILTALLPTNGDKITISELNVDLTGDAPTFTFDAQADALKEPFIDYNVLDSFKKSMQFMHYDFGNYVDKKGATIPAYCIVEKGIDGSLFNDEAKGIYAFWTIQGEGCNPSSDVKTSEYQTEDYEGEKVVRIWRTPQFSEWYKDNPSENEPQMDLNGNISNVPHFSSNCIHYTGDDSKDSANPKWSQAESDSDICKLVPGNEEGISISESSNGRGESDKLVLRFSAIITLAPEVYQFNNTHMIAIAPSGHHNVTDSYVQIQTMFGARASDCAEGDTACKDKSNSGEE